MKIEINLQSYQKKFAVYSLSFNDAIVYIGCCKYPELLQLPDLRKNNEWRRLMSNSDQDVTLSLLHICDEESIAITTAKTLVALHNPHFNRYGAIVVGKSSPIRCIQDNRLFDSIAQAAQFYGIASTTLSNHLCGRYGYASIRGLTFERI